MSGLGQVVSRLVTHASIGLMQLMAFLPLRWIRALGWGLGRVLFVLVRGRRRVTLTNLSLCFPERSEAERLALARQTFVCFAQTWLDRAWLWHAPAAWVRRRVQVTGAIDALQGSEPGPREDAVMALALDEIQHADTQALGVPMPHPVLGDKRLRALCEAVLRDPAEKNQLREWVAEVGASERTVARLFRDELGTSYQQWRTQAVLAHALPQLARGVPIAQVAAASGYASDSAFSAMFKQAMGKAPSYFQSKTLSK